MKPKYKTLNDLYDKIRNLGIVVEPDVTWPEDDMKAGSLGWGWWHQDHRPWHYAPKGKPRWDEREAMEEAIRTVTAVKKSVGKKKS